MELQEDYSQMKLVWGSTPHAHAIAKVKNPVEQGNVALLQFL